MDWAIGICDIELLGLVSNQWKTCILHDVLFVPNLWRNLFSLEKVVDKGIVVVYDKRSYKMFFNKKERKKALHDESLRRKSLQIIDEEYSTKHISNIVMKMVGATTL